MRDPLVQLIIVSVCLIKSKYFEVHWTEAPLSLEKLFEALAAELKDWTWLQGYQVPTPILYIDDANLLQDLVKNNM